MHSILYTFADSKTRDEFDAVLSQLAQRAESGQASFEDLDLTVLKGFLTCRLDPELMQAESSPTRVLVANKLIFEGMYKDAVRRFEQELGSHSAKVEMKKYDGEKWTTVRARRN